MSNYIKSKSKTGKTPRIGNQYRATYAYIPIDDYSDERVFMLIGHKIRNGKRVKDFVVFNSQAAAKKAGWVRV